MESQIHFFLMVFVALRLVCRPMGAVLATCARTEAVTLPGRARERAPLAVESTNGATKQPACTGIARLAARLTEALETQLRCALDAVITMLPHTVSKDALRAEMTTELTGRLATRGDRFVADVIRAGSVEECLRKIEFLARDVAFVAGSRLGRVQIDRLFPPRRPEPSTLHTIVSASLPQPATPAELAAFGSTVIVMGVDHGPTESRPVVSSAAVSPTVPFAGELSYF